MYTKSQIIQIAENYVNEMEIRTKIKLSILYDLLIEKKYGIIFFYNTLKYYETKDEKENILVGNSPFLIESKTGIIIDFGTNRSEQFYIKEYESGRWPVN